MNDLVTLECKDGGCLEELEAKMKGKPDFVAENQYCKGVGKYCLDDDFCVQEVAKVNFPTRFGLFTLYGFFDSRQAKEHTAIVRGDVAGKERVPLRMHSECHTGDVWGSLRCDCRDQLEFAIRHIAAEPFGAVIYLRQEGRGIGLLNKIKAYQLQDLGLDTIEANQYLGLPVDARDYRVAAKIIQLLGIRSVRAHHQQPRQDRPARGSGRASGRPDPRGHPGEPARQGLSRREAGEDGAPHLSRGGAPGPGTASARSVTVSAGSASTPRVRCPSGCRWR